MALRLRIGRHRRRQLADVERKVGQDPHELSSGRPEVAAQRGRIARAHEPFERLGERAVRGANDRVAGSVENEDAHPRRLVGELPDEAALARSRLAAEEDDAPALAPRPRQKRTQERELAGTAREREARHEPERTWELTDGNARTPTIVRSDHRRLAGAKPAKKTGSARVMTARRTLSSLPMDRRSKEDEHGEHSHQRSRRRARRELGDEFGGQLIGPDDTAYEEARKVYNGMIDRRPALIARCAGPDDVARTIRFAREHDLLLAVRGGGHNGGGLGIVDDGVVCDLSLLRSVEVDPKARTVKVGGGCTWSDVDAATSEFELAVPCGIISTTGVGGLTLGGGLGHLTRMYGLSIDNLLGADMVLADGTQVHAERQRASGPVLGDPRRRRQLRCRDDVPLPRQPGRDRPGRPDLLADRAEHRGAQRLP